MIAIKTKHGYITSYREAWKSPGGRSVWTWRTDGTDRGEPPFDFGSVEAAEKFIDEVNYLSTQKERDEAGWTVETV